MNRSLTLGRWALLGWVLLTGLLASTTGGCSIEGSKRASLYQKLVGTWSFQEVRLDGTTFNYRKRSVTLTFSQDDSSRTYVLRRTPSGDTATVRGAVDISDRQLLAMVTGFDGPLVWNFTFDAPSGFDSTVQFSLRRADDRSVQNFLVAIGLSGGARAVEIDLVRE